MRGDPELGAMARRVIDANHYVTLATLDPDGRPRLSPVYYTAAQYTDFYWVSSPQAHHSRNLAERPEVQIVIFDSTTPVGRGEAVYLCGTARQVPDEELEPVLSEAFRTAAGARRFSADELSGGAAFRLYLAYATHARSMSPAVTRYTAAESTPASQLTQPRPDETPPESPDHRPRPVLQGPRWPPPLIAPDQFCPLPGLYARAPAALADQPTGG